MHPAPDASFIPLSTGALPVGQRPEFRVTVLSQAQTRPLSVLNQAWSAIPQASAHEPRVTLQREGDQVSGIRIQCSCGRVFELACDYQNPEPPKEAAAPPSPA